MEPRRPASLPFLRERFPRRICSTVSRTRGEHSFWMPSRPLSPERRSLGACCWPDSAWRSWPALHDALRGGVPPHPAPVLERQVGHLHHQRSLKREPHWRGRRFARAHALEKILYVEIGGPAEALL